MSRAIEQIVDAYVRYNNRTALENLKSHRQKMLLDIRTRSSKFYDWGYLLGQIEDEIRSIDAGLEKLQPR